VLKVHTRDGLTSEVNLEDPAQLKVWAARFHNRAFQATITGLTIIQKGAQYSLPRPDGFGDVTLAAEPVEAGNGGERIILTLGDLKISLMVHNGQRAARVTVGRRWHRVFDPQNP
jgi:hypothetical protein